jgi:phosphoenolpyruvate carboxylase
MSAQYNLEQLVSAGIKNRLYSRYSADFTPEDRDLMERLSQTSFDAYSELKGHGKFLSYLQKRTTVPYYGMTNIGSRPDRRKSKESFTLKDLRAIPFEGSWTLNKQNIPGFFGLGRALEALKQEGKGGELNGLYQRSLFLQTLVQNSIMVLKKTNFNVTCYLKNDREFSGLWQILHEEYLRAEREALEISDSKYLMQNNAKDRLSIDLRERIILPLSVIHQYALCMMEELKSSGANDERQEAFIHMIIRSSYGIINAGRNSA